MFSVIAVIIAYIFGAPLFSFKHVNPIVQIPDSEVTLIAGDYSTLENDLVHGEITGKINENNIHPILLHICSIDDGKVYEENSIKYLECPLSSRKDTYIINGSFEIKLLSGEYFIDIPIPNKSKQSNFPARIRIHKGERITIEMTI